MLRLHCLMSEQDGTGLEQGGSDDASRQSKQSAQLGCCLARGSWTHRNVYQESTACRSIFPASASPRDNNSNRQGITMAVVPCLLLCIPLYCAFRGNRCVRPYMAGTHVRRKKDRF